MEATRFGEILLLEYPSNLAMNPAALRIVQNGHENIEKRLKHENILLRCQLWVMYCGIGIFLVVGTLIHFLGKINIETRNYI